LAVVVASQMAPARPLGQTPELELVKASAKKRIMAI